MWQQYQKTILRRKHPRCKSGTIKILLGNMSMFYLNLSDPEFQQLSKQIKDVCGMRIPMDKKALLESQLNKRLRVLGLSQFGEYHKIISKGGVAQDELQNLIHLVTIHYTEFFRRPEAFDYLAEKVLPTLIAEHDTSSARNIIAWSAASSTGEEAYSMAMVMDHFNENTSGTKFKFNILATDISSKVLEAVKIGIFPSDQCQKIPLEFREKYLSHCQDGTDQMMQIAPHIRELVHVRWINLVKIFDIKPKAGIIFFRNALIYFDRETQERILHRICDQLEPGGYLFMGHAESLSHFTLPIKQVAPLIYRKLRD